MKRKLVKGIWDHICKINYIIVSAFYVNEINSGGGRGRELCFIFDELIFEGGVTGGGVRVGFHSIFLAQ